jgi:hypothetical protein
VRLLDLISQTLEPLKVELADGDIVQLPGADTMSARLAHCATRYVLDDEVAALCTQAAFEHESVIGDCLDIMRLPASQIWIEFDNVGRASVLAHAGLGDDSPRSQRLGILMTSTGPRAGVAHFMWQSRGAPGAECAPVYAEFDLDDPALGMSGDNDRTFGVALANMEQLSPLFDRVRFRLDPQWRDYYRRVTDGPAHYRQVVQSVLAPLCGDLPVLFAFFLLMMTRGALQGRETDLARLNRARVNRGRAPLLDHIEMTLDLSARTVPANDLGPPQGRAHARLHLVRGHLVRRGDSIYWRSAHMRGNPELGIVCSRTVKLRLAGA